MEDFRPMRGVWHPLGASFEGERAWTCHYCTFALWDVHSTGHPDFRHNAISLAGWWLFGGVGWVTLAILHPTVRLFNQRRCSLSSRRLRCLPYMREVVCRIATAAHKSSGTCVQSGVLIPSVRRPIFPAKARWRIFAPCEGCNSRWVLCSGWLARLFNQTRQFCLFAAYLAFAGEMAVF